VTSGSRSLRFHVLGAILAAVGLVLAAQDARAAPELFVDLRYDIDPALRGCPTAAEFRTIVGQQLGYDPYRADATLRVEIRAQTVEHGIEGAIDWNDSTEERVGERRFASRSLDCHELMVTMGFVVAVQIQLLATERTNRPGPTPQAASATQVAPPSASRPEIAPVAVRPPPVVQSEPQAPVESSGVSSQPNRWSASAGLGPSVGLGLGPNAIAQGRLFVGVQYAMVSLELGAEASLPSTTRQDDGSGFRHNLILATIAACGHYGVFSGCALGKVGQIQVRGLGVDVPASPTGFVAQVGPRLAISLGLGDHLAVLAHTDGLYLLTPWTVDLNHTAFWTMPRFGAVVGIDVAARFR
jgi:hypothetical protein